MEVKEVKKDGSTLIIELTDGSIGFANLVREELWNDSNVEEAASIKDHPYLSEVKLFVKMKGKSKPQKALKDSTSRIESKIKELRKEFKKGLKK